MNANVSKINVNGSEMKYFTFGNGEKVLIIIPGLTLKPVSDSAEMVALSYNIFSKNNYTVYVFDVRENITSDFRIDNIADDIAEAMRILGIESANIFGCSMGGMAAMNLTVRYPELVKKLIICSSAAELKNKNIIKEWRNLAEKGEVVALNRCIFDKVYSEEYLETYSDAFNALETYGSPDELKRLICLIDAISVFNITDNLCDIKCPTFIIGSEKDKIMSSEQWIEISEKIGCECFISDKFSHAIYDEDSENHERIYNFFEKE